MNPTPTPRQLQDALAALKLARFNREGGLWQDALGHYARAASIWPGNAAIHAEIAEMGEQSGNWQLAEAASRRVLELGADDKAAWRLAAAVFSQERYAEALPLFTACARTAPGYHVEFNLGVCCNKLGRFADAARHFSRALAHSPDHPETWCMLAVALALGRDFAELERVVDKALQRFPGNADIGYVAADHFLRAGHYGRGFDLYDHRWQGCGASLVARALPLPRWRGETFAGPLLVWAEQGLGDELVFASMVPDLLARHPDTFLECDARLMPLFARSFPGLRLLDRKRDDILALRPEGDVRQCAAGDLGAILRRDAGDFPVHRGWLKADPARVARIRDEYRARFPGRLLVGISWASRRQQGLGDAKSMDIAQMAPLLQVPGAQFINLQYGAVDDDLARARQASGVDVFVDASIDSWNDLDGFAAQIAALDLVVSVSNTTVHVAGALGVPCWTLLNRHIGLFWYWGYEGDTSRWYPSMRPYFADESGRWQDVVAQVAADLRARAAGQAPAG